MTSTNLRPLAALAVVASIAAGCSSAPSETGTSAAPENSASAKAVRFAECMRKHGVSAFPDPDPSGEMTIDGVLNGSSIDPDGPAWKTAIAACKDLQPAGFTGPGKRSAAQQDAALAFAQCIRDHGVTDFPDPVDGEPLVDTNRIPSTRNGLATLNAAMQACGDAARDAIARR